MPMQWNETTVRWYVDASEYTGYSRALADLLAPELVAEGTLCDLGCGLSLTDMELAPRVRHVTCVDESACAIEQTRQLAAQRGIANLTAVCGDARLTEGTFDTVMCLFHGSMELYVERYLRLARRKMIAVVHDDPEELVAQPEKYRIRELTSVRQMSEFLTRQGIAHTFSRHCLEFGQPLKDREDARAYALYYQKPENGETADAYLDRCTVPAKDGSAFELYLPLKRKFAVFIINQ